MESEFERKYELTDEIKVVDHRELHRIRAVRDLKTVRGFVQTGELGGWVEHEKNLSHEGNCWVFGEAMVYENAKVCDSACVEEQARVFGGALVCGCSQVYGYAKVAEKASIFEDAAVYDKARVYENAKISGCAQIFGNAKVSGSALVYRNAKVHGNAFVYGTSSTSENAQIFESASVHGNAQIRSDAQIGGSADICGNASIRCSGYLTRIRDYMIIGPIGSRADYTTFYLTKDRKIMVSCGCFNGTIEEFKDAVIKTHGRRSKHGKDYLRVISTVKGILGKE